MSQGLNSAFTLFYPVCSFISCSALGEAICGKNCFRVGFCMQWIRLSNVISLHNIVVVREEGNEFLKIYRGPVFNCYVTLKPIFRMLMLHTRILNLNTLGLKKRYSIRAWGLQRTCKQGPADQSCCTLLLFLIMTNQLCQVSPSYFHPLRWGLFLYVNTAVVCQTLWCVCSKMKSVGAALNHEIVL